MSSLSHNQLVHFAFSPLPEIKRVRTSQIKDDFKFSRESQPPFNGAAFAPSLNHNKQFIKCKMYAQQVESSVPKIVHVAHDHSPF
jgi:hypothetical protein